MKLRLVEDETPPAWINPPAQELPGRVHMALIEENGNGFLTDRLKTLRRRVRQTTYVEEALR